MIGLLRALSESRVEFIIVRGAAATAHGSARLTQDLDLWDSEEELSAALQSEAGIEAGRALLEDEREFIDFEVSSLFVTEEPEIF